MFGFKITTTAESYLYEILTPETFLNVLCRLFIKCHGKVHWTYKTGTTAYRRYTELTISLFLDLASLVTWHFLCHNKQVKVNDDKVKGLMSQGHLPYWLLSEPELLALADCLWADNTLFGLSSDFHQYLSNVFLVDGLGSVGIWFIKQPFVKCSGQVVGWVNCDILHDSSTDIWNLHRCCYFDS